MFKNLCNLMIASFLVVSSCLVAEVKYEIHDIGTLQTHSSVAIAINNNGQILGWYNVDGSKAGKHFFVRDPEGSFHEIIEDPSIVYENVPADKMSNRIEWKFLLEDGTAYGTFDNIIGSPTLFMWNTTSGIVKLGNLPGKVISAINNQGQVLIKNVTYNDLDGKNVVRPVIWENGKITKLNGLEGDLGIASEESYGFDMNNKGEVVGQSVVYRSYKNNIYKQTHATKWANGKAIDLHNVIPKTESSNAIAINDLGEIFMTGGYLIKETGETVKFRYGGSNIKTTNINYIYDLDKHGHSGVYHKDGKTIIDNSTIANIILNDPNSIWMNVSGIIGANDNGEVIAQGATIYGEQHAMILKPLSSN